MALIAWGTFAALTGVIRQFWLLSLDRLLLGVAESLILPAMLVLLTRWFTREERSRANAVLILGNPVTVLWMSIITVISSKALDGKRPSLLREFHRSFGPLCGSPV